MFVVKYTKQFLIATAAVFIVSAGILFIFGLPLGIDFTGGALSEVSYDERPDKSALEQRLEQFDLGGFSLRETMTDAGREGLILRTRDLSEEERQEIETLLLEAGSGAEVERFTSVGPVIGAELKQKAQWAISGVVVIIILYIAFSFRSVPKPISSWRYGMVTIFALIHDVLVPTAVFSILGATLGAEADVLFVMALLAVLGYSVNDTIVIIDRIRENLLKNEAKSSKDSFETIVGASVSQTLARSINTSLTTLLALLALFIFGGEVTRNFALVLIAGVLAGTYSSICVVNPLLIFLGKRAVHKKTKSKS